MSIVDTPPTILCVDDEPVLLMVRELVLSSAGYTVITASTADEAMHLFRRRQVDLVITDHLLPGRTGVEMAADMKKLRPEIHIMLVTGMPDLTAGMEHIDKCLLKGSPTREFLAHVEELTTRHQS